MDIVYTEYAEGTIEDRNIGKKEIESALLNPDGIVEGKKNRKIAHKLIENKLLRIVFEVEENAYIVITAYYTQPRRYMNV